MFKKLTTLSILGLFVFGFAFTTTTYAMSPVSNILPSIGTSQTLRYGMKSNIVELLQQKLQNLGLYNIAIDGSFGPGTLRAVKDFQGINNLKQDGIAGRNTIGMLEARGFKGESNVNKIPEVGLCTTAYEPVCGLPAYVPGSGFHSIKTYPNMCAMEMAEAVLQYEGKCTGELSSLTQ